MSNDGFYSWRSVFRCVRIGLFAFATVITSLHLTACKNPNQSQSELRVGALLSLTGATAEMGRSAADGIRLAVEETNAAGGVLGKKITLIIEDDQSTADAAKSGTTKLIEEHRVAAILGEIASSRTLAAAPVAQAAKIPLLSPGSTNAAVTKVGDFIFRACFEDTAQGSAMARFARGELKLDRVAILQDTTNEYSTGLAQVFATTFATAGGTIVANESYREGERDFRTPITLLKTANPQAIYIPGYYGEVAPLAKQLREAGSTAILLGGDGWDATQLLEQSGTALEGSYFTNHYAIDDPNPAVAKFVAQYRARFGRTPNNWAVLSYDAAHMLFAAVIRANSIQPAQIRDALATTQNFPGLSGSITLDAARNPQKPVTLLKIAHGQFEFAKRL